MELIREEGYADTMRRRVEPALAGIRSDCMVEAAGGRVHVECYRPADARAQMLLLHGYTESAEKFRELIWYFTRAGYAVIAPDQRGHGSSLRLVDDPSDTHVERFSDYVDDAKHVMETCFKKEHRSVLYGHSMGGAVAALLLMEEERFDRAVLSSPMIAPSSAPLPMWAGLVIAEGMCLAGRSRSRAFIGRAYDAALDTFDRSPDTSAARFAYYREKRAAQTRLQTNAPTYGWVREAVHVTRRLLDPRSLSQIRTPVLLCQAGRETIVRTAEQERFAAGLPNGRIVRFPAAKHEIYMADDRTMAEYLGTVLCFLDGRDGKL